MGIYTCSVDLDDPDADAIRDYGCYLMNPLLFSGISCWRVNDALNTNPLQAIRWKRSLPGLLANDHERA